MHTHIHRITWTLRCDRVSESFRIDRKDLSRSNFLVGYTRVIYSSSLDKVFLSKNFEKSQNMSLNKSDDLLTLLKYMLRQHNYSKN